MAHRHPDGTEEQRPRTPEEIAAIEEKNRIAARVNVRSGEDRRKVDRRTRQGILQHARYDREFGCRRRLVDNWNDIKTAYFFERRNREQRAILSTFERNMLMGEK